MSYRLSSRDESPMRVSSTTEEKSSQRLVPTRRCAIASVNTLCFCVHCSSASNLSSEIPGYMNMVGSCFKKCHCECVEGTDHEIADELDSLGGKKAVPHLKRNGFIVKIQFLSGIQVRILCHFMLSLARDG